MNSQEKIKLFTSLFKGRTDVFARRWERWSTDISGYSPAYIDKEKQKYLALNDYFIDQDTIDGKYVTVNQRISKYYE